MNIKIADQPGRETTLSVDTIAKVDLTNVFNGVGITTTEGVRFGVSQRDSGIEVMVNDKLICIDGEGNVKSYAASQLWPGEEAANKNVTGGEV